MGETYYYWCNSCQRQIQTEKNEYLLGVTIFGHEQWTNTIKHKINCDFCSNIESDCWESEGGQSQTQFERDIKSVLNYYKENDED